MSKFKKINCAVCGKEISTGGAAFCTHMRMHSRKKEVMEIKRGKRIVFMTENEHRQHLQDNPYALLGEEQLPEQPKEVWEIRSLANEMPAVDPEAYFITSGEAVKKAEKLVQDLYSLAVKARSFRDKLRKCRGKKKYLETSREDNRLIIKSKNPRKLNQEYVKTGGKHGITNQKAFRAKPQL